MVQEKIFQYFNGNSELHVLFIFDPLGQIDSDLCEAVWPEGYRYVVFGGESASSSGSPSGKKGSEGDEKIFSMAITGESLGMKYTVKARCKVADKKVTYIEWNENETVK